MEDMKVTGLAGRLLLLLVVIDLVRAKVEDSPVDHREPNDYNTLHKNQIVEEVIKKDKELFRIEVEAKERDVEIMREIRSSPYGKTYFFDKNMEASNLGEYYGSIISYQGHPVGLFIYLLMPVVAAKFFFIILTRVKPLWRRQEGGNLEYPVVPLIYFQQSPAESRIRRSSRKSVDAISRSFVIRANEAYVDIGEIRNSALTRRTLMRSPWALVRFLVRLQAFQNEMEEGRRRQAVQSNRE